MSDPWDVFAEAFPKPRLVSVPAPTPQRPASESTAYAQAALASEVDRLTAAVEGERNMTLFKAAANLYELVNGGALDKGDVDGALAYAARSVGLDDVEIRQTLRSAEAKTADKARTAPERPEPVVVALDAPVEPDEVQYDPETGEVIEVDRTTWWPRDLDAILSGDVVEEDPPAFLARQDGHRLFYAGKVNALIGESESGKTWIGLLAVVQALHIGQRVLYLDFEDTAPGIVARLRLMGCTDRHLSNLNYIGPDESLENVRAKRDLREHLANQPPALIVFDGVNAAMTLMGLDLEKNKDATNFSLTLLRPLKRTGAAVITIDHVTKSRDNRGSYAIGAQAKRADIDGCALLVEVIQPFGKGMKGKLKLTVSKDRPGQVRAVSAGAKAAGTAYIDSTAGDSTSCWIEPPDLRPAGEKPAFRPTMLMERISKFLADVPDGSDGVATRGVINGVSGNDKAIGIGLGILVEEGFVTKTLTGSGAFHRNLRPYVEELDPLSEKGRGPVANDGHGVAMATGRDRGHVAPSLQGATLATATATDAEDEGEGWWQK